MVNNQYYIVKYIRDLHKRMKDLEEIEEEHRKLNGALRSELNVLYKSVVYEEDNGLNECILCGTKLKEIDNGF